MNPPNLLVVGGAGYIGSHMIKRLVAAGARVVCLDNLSTGHRDAVLGGELIVGDLADRDLLERIFSQNRFDGVMHFASLIEVGESVRDPSRYYSNNLVNTLNLLDAMVRHGVARLIFSSSAAVYGEPVRLPIDEDHPIEPVSPYGRTKWMVEQILEDYDRAYGLKSVRLRYFNAAGADPDGALGERHPNETHLVPLVLRTAAGRNPHITVFGTDYDTPDGTCVRDYIHVTDLCEAHLLAYRWMADTGRSGAFNLGNGDGYSVNEVLTLARQITGRDIVARIGPRRPGDPARLVADSARARSVLGWTPVRSALADILRDAWHWEQKKNLNGTRPTAT